MKIKVVSYSILVIAILVIALTLFTGNREIVGESVEKGWTVEFKKGNVSYGANSWHGQVIWFPKDQNIKRVEVERIEFIRGDNQESHIWNGDGESFDAQKSFQLTFIEFDTKPKRNEKIIATLYWKEDGQSYSERIELN
ncbi:hypothetical protein [Alkalihalobacillus sp. LMS39]|uniref:hypothetical protein n=1 Tax=Alkalihalobacillus sp. LMS39 TaxID=2924032 RepID=UPI001FB51151|nr:hypothetical protein [Alkalihalobacillus sp. LMS39]UOE94735.1 hypothetical protein MM271_03555 [Alkalihalobacillus sp. LMS39]